MRTIFIMLISVMLIGCGAPVVESTVPPASEHHGGVLVPLTDQQCYVELLNGKRERKGKAYETNLVAYVLQPDQKTAYAETPTSVEVRMSTPKGDMTVPLRHAPEADDPVGSCRFVSTAGPFELSQGGGEITVQAGGKSLTGTFRGPR
jgi:hypothetical protein